MSEWLDCIKAASNCGADAVTAAQVPRALEWFDLVRPAMAALITTPTDALATLDDLIACVDSSADAITDELLGLQFPTSYPLPSPDPIPTSTP